MEDVKRAVISAASSSLRLAVLRKPVVVMRRERAYMNMPDVASEDEWDQVTRVGLSALPATRRCCCSPLLTAAHRPLDPTPIAV